MRMNRRLNLASHTSNWCTILSSYFSYSSELIFSVSQIRARSLSYPYNAKKISIVCEITLIFSQNFYNLGTCTIILSEVNVIYVAMIYEGCVPYDLLIRSKHFVHLLWDHPTHSHICSNTGMLFLRSWSFLCSSFYFSKVKRICYSRWLLKLMLWYKCHRLYYTL